MSLGQRYLFGMLSGAGSVLVKTGLNILLIPILIAKLGLDSFGLYILFIAILEVATLLDLGATDAMTTLLNADSQDLNTRHRYLNVGHVLFGGIAGLFLAVGLLVLPHFSTLFHISGPLQSVAHIGFLFILIEAALMIYSCYAHSVLLAHCSHQWTNLADTLYSVIANAGAIIALCCGFGLPVIFGIRLASAVLRLLIMLFHARKLESALFRPSVPFSQESFKKVARLCSHAGMINFSIIMSHKLDDIVIASFLPLSAVGIYEIVFRFLGITIQVCLKLHEGAYPIFSKLAAQQQVAEARQFFLRMSSFMNFIATMILMLIVLHYDVLFHLFSAGKIPMEQTLPVLIIAVPCILSGVLQMPAGAWLFTWGHQKFLSGTSILTALANLFLSILLVQHIGIVGVALGTLIPQLIQHQVGLIGKTCRELHIPVLQYIRNVHLTLLAPLLVAILWVLCWRPLIDSFTMPLLPIGLISGSAFLIAGLIWFKLTATPLEANLLKQLFMVKRLQPIQDQPTPTLNLDNAG